MEIWSDDDEDDDAVACEFEREDVELDEVKRVGEDDDEELAGVGKLWFVEVIFLFV